MWSVNFDLSQPLPYYMLHEQQLFFLREIIISCACNNFVLNWRNNGFKTKAHNLCTGAVLWLRLTIAKQQVQDWKPTCKFSKIANKTKQNNKHADYLTPL